MDDETKRNIADESADARWRFEIYEDDNHIVHTKFIGEMDSEGGVKYYAALVDESRKAGKKILVCADTTAAGPPSPESRKYLADNMLGKDSVVEKYAVVEDNLSMRLLINLYARISKVPMKCHKTKQDAVSWLMGGSDK